MVLFFAFILELMLKEETTRSVWQTARSSEGFEVRDIITVKFQFSTV